MKNKRLSTIAATLLIIVFTVVSVGILWVIFRNIEISKYEVTKEVCYHELVRDKLTFPEDFNLTDCSTKINITGSCYKDIYGYGYLLNIVRDYDRVNITTYQLLTFDNTSLEIKGNIYRTVCETEEVRDNIIYWCYGNNTDCGKIRIDDKFLISTEDWLRVNCKCLDMPYGTSQCKWNVPEDCILERGHTGGVYLINSSRLECLNCGQEYVFPEECSQFKCGDYIVNKLK